MLEDRRCELMVVHETCPLYHENCPFFLCESKNLGIIYCVLLFADTNVLKSRQQITCLDSLWLHQYVNSDRLVTCLGPID